MAARERGPALLRHTAPQWRRAYGRRAFLRLGVALGAAAVLAYSGADEAFDRWHTGLLDPREGRAEAAREALRASGRKAEAKHLKTESFPGSASDLVARAFKPWGERELFLIWGTVGLADWLWRTNPVTRWGRANFEAMCVGLPTLWTVQRGLGANRPSSRDGSPRWRPLQHANSASGHAFMGAIPFWNLARRLDARWAQWLAASLGAVTGWSRLNDRKHYLSQVLLGWTIAWNAVAAVGPEAAAPDAAVVAEEAS
ncbi:MAG: phosphatase PAP2 family protein [Candidatus Krumholzibacteriia bacterium]